MKKPTKILIGLVAGIIAGLLAHPYASNPVLNWIDANVFASVGQVFLRIIFMAVVPLVFSALVLGVAEIAEAGSLGRVARRTLFFTLVASTFSVILGVSLVNLLKPGSLVAPQLVSQGATSDGVAALQKSAADTKSFTQILVELIPKNPIDSAARALSGEIVALMVFALFFGIALQRVRNEDEKSPVLGVLKEIYSVSLQIISFAMSFAPVAVFCLVFGSMFRFGAELLVSLMAYVGVVVLGLLIQQFVVYSALLKAFTKRSPLAFFHSCREVYLYAFSTASSNATLPRTLDVAERELGLTPHISRFVLTIGSTANQNGTALFEGITVLFLAQVYGVHLDLMQQLQVVLMSILAGIGTAGVPGGSLPLVLIVMQSVGIPAEGLGLILGVDRFLDMCRTTLNVSGDLVIAALVDDKAT